MPDDIVAAALGIDPSEVQKISELVRAPLPLIPDNCLTPLQIPDNIAYALEECTKRCGIDRANQPTKQLQKNVAGGPTSSNSTGSYLKGSLGSSLDGQNKGLLIGLIVAVGVMALGYIVLAAVALFRRRKVGKGTARGYVKTGETFAPGGMYDSEKYELPSEPLRTPYDPPSGSH